MVISVLVSAACAMIWSTPPARWMHWRDFSVLWLLCAFAGSFVLLCIISLVGTSLLTATMKNANDVTIVQQFAAGFTAQAALRRGNRTGRGSNMALGMLIEFQLWIEGFVKERIRKWAKNLSDDDLLAAAADTDNKSKGIPSKASIAQRATWRDEHAAHLRAGGALQAEARTALRNLVVTAYSTYFLRKAS